MMMESIFSFLSYFFYLFNQNPLLQNDKTACFLHIVTCDYEVIEKYWGEFGGKWVSPP